MPSSAAWLYPPNQVPDDRTVARATVGTERRWWCCGPKRELGLYGLIDVIRLA